MKQIVQPTGGGSVEVVESPVPVCGPTEVLVRTEATLISAGTEKAVTGLAQSSLLEKARARPDLVRQVINRAKVEGVRSTVETVRSRLADDLPLGYSGAGTVVAVGDQVRGVSVGQRVATGGAGCANHAEYQAVPGLLCVPVPEGLTAEHAAFATVASVGLHGLRLADAGPGSRIVVVGLGLIGQLTARMAMASGCDVAGIDIRPEAVALAAEHGVHALIESGNDTTTSILEWSRGRGADAIIITAGSRGDSSILERVPSRCRDRAVVVAVGDVGLDVPRNDFYLKELRLEVPRSYGPGRYDRSYEEWAVDYPIGHVRWTEGRNMEAVLDLLAARRLDISDLITHRIDIGNGASAYDVLDDPASGARGIVLQYPDRGEAASARTLHFPSAGEPRAMRPGKGIGVLGAGLFVRSTILPLLKRAGLGDVVHIASASGVTAARVAERNGVARASADAQAVIDDPEVGLVVVATPHSSHAEMVIAALDAGKDVYCEKPLAITEDELQAVVAAYERNSGVLYVGFNRRYSPMVERAIEILHASAGPVNITYRVNAGPLPAGHWYADRREGGRLLGEVCHFIDTCNALVGDVEVAALHCASPNSDEHDNYHLLIRYEDGSSATILYSGEGHGGTPKEWCEVLGGGHTVVIDNYERMTVDGDRLKIAAGKGHSEGLVSVVSGGAIRPAMVTTEIAIRAVACASSRC